MYVADADIIRLNHSVAMVDQTPPQGTLMAQTVSVTLPQGRKWVQSGSGKSPGENGTPLNILAWKNHSARGS